VTSYEIVLGKKVKNVSINQKQRLQCSISNSSEKYQHLTALLEDYLRDISGKSGDFTFSCSEEVENISANQRPGQPSWISNPF
jgi:hypothetical protein